MPSIRRGDGAKGVGNGETTTGANAAIAPSSLSDLGLDFVPANSSASNWAANLAENDCCDGVWWRRGGFLALPSVVRARHWGAQPKLSANIRLMFQAMVTRLHSPRTR